MLITHDLGVVAETASASSSCMPAARSRRRAVEALFEQPLHPYTRGLMRRDPAPRRRGRRGRRAAPAAGDPRPGADPDASRSSAAPSRRAAASPPSAAAPSRRRSSMPAPATRSRAGKPSGCRASAHERAACPRGREPGEAFPVHGAAAAAPRRRGEGGRRRELRDRPGRDAGPGGRIRLRQVDHRQDDAEADRAHRRPHPAGRRGRHRVSKPGAMRPHRRRIADGLPGSLFVAQPAHDRRHDRRRAAGEFRPRRAAERPTIASPRLFERVGLAARRHAQVRRTNSPAASASASASPGRWRSVPT